MYKKVLKFEEFIVENLSNDISDEEMKIIKVKASNVGLDLTKNISKRIEM